jgi:hypothetical protein
MIGGSNGLINSHKSHTTGLHHSVDSPQFDFKESDDVM